MPLPDDGSPVARVLQMVNDVFPIAIEFVRQRVHSVLVAVLPGEHRRSARRANIHPDTNRSILGLIISGYHEF